MGKAFAPSGRSQRLQAIDTATKQQAELNKQKALAEDQQASALQGVLERDTQRLLRTFGTRALVGGNGLSMPTR